jgi:hypothetical protein
MSITSLHQLIREQVRAGRGQVGLSDTEQLRQLSTSERKATQSMRRRLRRALGRNIIPPAGTAVWG